MFTELGLQQLIFEGDCQVVVNAANAKFVCWTLAMPYYKISE